MSKRRIHRSSAPGQLSGVPQLANQNNEAVDVELPELYRSVSMESEPLVNQDIDLEIEGGMVAVDGIDPGVVDTMEVEEEEDVNGDVIRCLCNETEEGGFMIQVRILNMALLN